MNYRHAFHAGNVADVFKHVMLTRILLYLVRKPTSLRYLETHAGAGSYDLSSAAASRTKEWCTGIGRLLAAAAEDANDAAAAAPLALLQPYLDLARRAHPLYPGSPALAAALLRPQDRLICCELHPPTAAALATNLGRRAKIIERDGYMALNAFVPPPERRGIVMIDPPFEQRDEFERLSRAVASAWRKWPTGVYLAWYPLKAPGAGAAFGAALRAAQIARVLQLEFAVDDPHPDRPLAANGLVVINPPFGFEDEARALLPYLTDRLATGPGASFRVDWIAPP